MRSPERRPASTLPVAVAGRGMGREAALGPVGEGARAGGKLAWPDLARAARPPDGWPWERVGHVQLDNLAGASRAPLYDASILFSLPRG